MMNFFQSILITQSCHCLWLVIIVNRPVSCLGALITLLLGLFENVYLIVAPPKMISFRVLLLNKLIVGNVCRQKGILVGSISTLGDMPETSSKFVLRIFAWNESTVAGYLSAWVGRHFS
jgi:hypothetical protein